MTPPSYSSELERINEKLDAIHAKLFIDNGEPCLQSKVRRCNDVVNCVLWMIGVIFTAMVGIVMMIIFPSK